MFFKSEGDMNETKENWLKTVLIAYRHLEKVEKSLKKSVDVYVNSGFGGNHYRYGLDNEQLFDKIIELKYRLQGIYNLKALVDKVMEAMNGNTGECLKFRFIDNLGVAEAAKKLGTSVRNVFRLTTRGLEQMGSLMQTFGFDENRLTEEYENEPFVYGIFRRLTEEKYFVTKNDLSSAVRMGA